MTEAILLVACAALAGAVVTLAVALAAVRRRLDALEHAELAPDAGVVTGAGAPSASGEPPAPEAPVRAEPATEYVITRVGSGQPDAEQVDAPDARLFADLVLRESVVRAASFAHGVRRGLSPAHRNRIWFEMRREVKRARKQRRADEREAVREWKARQRAALDDRPRAGTREDDAA